MILARATAFGSSLTDREDVDALLNSIPEPHLDLYEVGTAVNSPRNNTPDLLRPVHRQAHRGHVIPQFGVGDGIPGLVLGLRGAGCG